MKTARLIAAIATLCLAACATAPEEQLRIYGDRLFVPAAINGVETEALLDSGAEMSLIDAEFARSLSLVAAGTETARGTGGTQEVGFVQDVDIVAGGVELGGRTVAVLDLRDISERVVGRPVTAIIGRELFDAGRFRLDIERGQFHPVSDQARPPGVRVPLTEHAGIMQFPIRIDDADPIPADFDLGNGNEPLIGLDYARRNGLLADERIIGEREGGGIGGPVSRKLVRLGSVTIAGETFQDVVAAIDPTENAVPANIGVSLLRRFVMTIDFGDGALWLAPRKPGQETPGASSPAR